MCGLWGERDVSTTTDRRRVPMCMRTRPWTPNERITREDGTQVTSMHIKRVCNGCGAQLGDMTDNEMAAAMGGRRLPDVRDECPFCQRGKK